MEQPAPQPNGTVGICPLGIESSSERLATIRWPASPERKEFAQIPPIFLPFPKTDAVESAASGKNG